MAYAQSGPGFIAYPHATQTGTRSANRLMNRMQREATSNPAGRIERTSYGMTVALENGVWFINGEEHVEWAANEALVANRARVFNAPYRERFDALCLKAGGVKKAHWLGDSDWVIPTRFGEWHCHFDDRRTGITANFQTREPALLQAAHQATGSSAINGKLGFYTDADTERVIGAFERAVKQAALGAQA